jgi:hypothetical protein
MLARIAGVSRNGSICMLHLRLSPEDLEQLTLPKGLYVEFTLSPSLSASPLASPAVADSESANGSEGDPPTLRSEPPTGEDNAGAGAPRERMGELPASGPVVADTSTLIGWRQEIEEAGLAYAAASDALELHYGCRPSAQEAPRGEMLEWLGTMLGHRAYEEAKAARPALIEQIKRIPPAQRPATIQGKRPSELSALVMRDVLEASRPPAQKSRCSSCDAPIVWVAGERDAKIPCEVDELRASPKGPGRRVMLTGADGVQRAGNLDPDGNIVGRERHFAYCPEAARHRKGARP